jgi:hypothetical protein
MPVYAATVVTVDIQYTKNEEVRNKKQIVTIDGDRIRFDFLGTEKQRSETTPYLLTIDGGKNYVLGNTSKDKSYCAKVEPADFFKRLGTMLADFDRLVKPETLEIKLEKTKEEPGPKLLGYPTTHIQLVTTGKGSATFLFKKHEYDIKHIDDVWYTTEIDFQPFKKRWFEAMVQTGYPMLDDMFRERHKHITGPILKIESKMLTTNVLKNKTTVETEKAVISSVKELKSDELPKQLFELPRCKNISQKQLISNAIDMFDEGKTGW